MKGQKRRETLSRGPAASRSWRAEACEAPGWPIPHQSNRFRSGPQFGYAAHGWSGSTWRSPESFNNPLESHRSRPLNLAQPSQNVAPPAPTGAEFRNGLSAALRPAPGRRARAGGTLRRGTDAAGRRRLGGVELPAQLHDLLPDG